MSQNMQIFDPLGYLNGWILNAKLIIQKLWQLNYDWDDEVPRDLLHRWKQWKYDIGSISQVRIPRPLFQNEAGGQVELHAFCDASEKALLCCLLLSLAATRWSEDKLRHGTCSSSTSEDAHHPSPGTSSGGTRHPNGDHRAK